MDNYGRTRLNPHPKPQTPNKKNNPHAHKERRLRKNALLFEGHLVPTAEKREK